MKFIRTTVAIAKANDDEITIDEAGFDALAQKLVNLAAAAGWDKHAAIAKLINELTNAETEVNFAADVAARQPRQP